MKGKSAPRAPSKPKPPEPKPKPKPRMKSSNTDIESQQSISTKGQSSSSDNNKISTPAERKLQRQLSYLIISVLIQTLCAIIVVLAIIWSTIQALRIVGFIGISQEPPGLAYGTDGSGFTPFPPNSPPQFIFG